MYKLHLQKKSKHIFIIIVMKITKKTTFEILSLVLGFKSETKRFLRCRYFTSLF